MNQNNNNYNNNTNNYQTELAFDESEDDCATSENIANSSMQSLANNDNNSNDVVVSPSGDNSVSDDEMKANNYVPILPSIRESISPMSSVRNIMSGSSVRSSYRNISEHGTMNHLNSMSKRSNSQHSQNSQNSNNDSGMNNNGTKEYVD